MRAVPVGTASVEALAPVLGASRYAGLERLAADAGALMHGRELLNVNSTATGGGVAEMLQSLLAYVRGTGIDVRWAVVDGNPQFFDITKRIHNRIHGFSGDAGELGPAERTAYDRVLAGQADDALAHVRKGDVVVLHDPQTLGLARTFRRAGTHVVWRCHIGADRQNAETAAAWAFLAPYLDDVERVVVSRSVFAPPGFPSDLVHVIPPSLDPLAVKNVELSEDQVRAILAYAGLVQGDDVPPAVFSRRDGMPARVDRRADVLQLGPPPPYDAPLVVQVSRWDRLKDMGGVMAAFCEHLDGMTNAHLVLAGPVVTGVADDPEGAAVYHECVDAWRSLPHVVRQRVHLACLPTADVEENAVIVNALQRHATVVAQKSLAEGFGLTVVEAMWKSRPVVAGAVGGIVDQITGGSGVLVDPVDGAAFAAAVGMLLDNPAQASKIGAEAHERSRDFLPDLHLGQWAGVLAELIGA